MVKLDIAGEIAIAREPTDVASVMFDPRREPEWVQVVTGVEVVDPGIGPGARVRRTGSFMGREFTWTTAVAAFQFPHMLALDIAEGLFVGRVTFGVDRAPGGSIARIRTTGEATGLGAFAGSWIEGPLKAALTADLERLKALVEAA